MCLVHVEKRRCRWSTGHPYLVSTLQHCLIRNVCLSMLKSEMSCAGKSNKDLLVHVQHMSIFTTRDINRLEFRSGDNGLEASFFCASSPGVASDLTASTLRRGDLASRSSQWPSCLPRVLTFIMWPPIVLPTPFRHSRNQPVSHTRKMTSLFNTIRASIYGAWRLRLHVYSLLIETDRLGCNLYSHLSSDGGTFSISVGHFGSQWVLYPI